MCCIMCVYRFEYRHVLYIVLRFYHCLVTVIIDLFVFWLKKKEYSKYGSVLKTHFNLCC